MTTPFIVPLVASLWLSVGIAFVLADLPLTRKRAELTYLIEVKMILETFCMLLFWLVFRPYKVYQQNKNLARQAEIVYWEGIYLETMNLSQEKRQAEIETLEELCKANFCNDND